MLGLEALDLGRCAVVGKRPFPATLQQARNASLTIPASTTEVLIVQTTAVQYV